MKIKIYLKLNDSKNMRNNKKIDSNENYQWLIKIIKALGIMKGNYHGTIKRNIKDYKEIRFYMEMINYVASLERYKSF